MGSGLTSHSAVVKRLAGMTNKIRVSLAGFALSSALPWPALLWEKGQVADVFRQRAGAVPRSTFSARAVDEYDPHGQVDGLHMLGEGADGDVVHSGFGNGTHALDADSS